MLVPASHGGPGFVDGRAATVHRVGFGRNRKLSPEIPFGRCALQRRGPSPSAVISGRRRSCLRPRRSARLRRAVVVHAVRASRPGAAARINAAFQRPGRRDRVRM